MDMGNQNLPLFDRKKGEGGGSLKNFFSKTCLIK